MMKNLLLIVAITCCQFAAAQTLTNNQEAIQIVDKAIGAYGQQPANLKLFGTGILHNLGHYETPEKTIDIPLKEQYAFFPDLQVALSYSSIARGDNEYIRESISKKDSTYFWGYYDEEYSKYKGFDELVQIAKSNPFWFLSLARKEPSSLRLLESPESDYNIIAGMPDGHIYNLYIAKVSYLLNRVERMVYHNIYGDAVLKTEYKDYDKLQGYIMPGKRHEYEFGIMEREISYDSLAVASIADSSNFSLQWLPQPFLGSLNLRENQEEKITFEKLSDNVDLIKYESQNNKSLLVKLPEGLGLFETPQGILLNRQLIEAVKKRYPGKEITHLFLTHHHPDHAGGMRAFTDINPTVVTTKGNVDYFNKLSHTAHLSLHETTPTETQFNYDFVALNGQKKYGGTVTAYEIGKQTGHTDEHLVYYFPSEKFLWTGDLIFFREDGTIYPAGNRGGSVHDLITNYQLDVDRIYTSWPLHEQKEYGTVEFLQKLVETK